MTPPASTRYLSGEKDFRFQDLPLSPRNFQVLLMMDEETNVFVALPISLAARVISYCVETTVDIAMLLSDGDGVVFENFMTLGCRNSCVAELNTGDTRLEDLHADDSMKQQLAKMSRDAVSKI